MSGTHSRIAPSSLARTVQCPASLTMQERYPESDGVEAAEGEAAHWAFASETLVDVGVIAPNGVVLDEEMIQSSDAMRDLVESWATPGGARIEQRLTIPSVHAECYGTPDAYAWAVPRRHLRVADLKHGHGFVEVRENWQLMAYAWGAFDESKITGAEEFDLTVDLTIVQPRSFHRDGPVRTWSTTGGDLRAYRNIAQSAATEALGPNPRAHVGPECKYCKARYACETLQRAALDVVDVVGKAEPLDLPTAAAAHELRRLDYASGLLEARRAGLASQLMSAARAGEQVPHFHVEHGEGREAWSKPPAEVFALGDLYGVELRKPAQPITPAQARKKGVDLPGFSVRPAGAAKLVADSPYSAAKVFG